MIKSVYICVIYLLAQFMRKKHNIHIFINNLYNLNIYYFIYHVCSIMYLNEMSNRHCNLYQLSIFIYFNNSVISFIILVNVGRISFCSIQHCIIS